MSRIVRRTLVIGLLLAAATAVRAGDPLATLLDPYFRVQAALSDDSVEGVAADGAAIAAAARVLGAPAAPIAEAADTLAAASSLAAARAAFGALSDAVIAYAETTKAAPGEGVTTMVCPMANKQWLQKGEAVSNPYFGKAMKTCGEKKKSV